MNSNDRTFLTTHVFAYLKGELEQADRRRFEGLLLASEEASDYVSRLSDMMRAMRSADAATWSDTNADTHFLGIEEAIQGVRSSGASLTQELPFQAAGRSESVAAAPAPEDAMFGAILTRIGVEDAGETLTLLHGDTATYTERPAQEAEVPAGTDREDTAAGAGVDVVVANMDMEDEWAAGAARGRWAYALAALVVVGVLGLLAMRMFGDSSPAVESQPGGAGSVVAQAPAVPVVPEVTTPDAMAETTETLPMAVSDALALAAADPVVVGGVSVFADPSADWTVSEGPAHVLDLRHGAVLVEFVAQADGEALRVRTPDYDVAVVGTVFFASVGLEGPEVGVMTGAVEVTADAQAWRVEGGSVYDAQRGVVEPEQAQIIDWMGERVDLQAHELALAERAQAVAAASRAPERSTRRERPAPATRAERNAPVVVAAPEPIRQAVGAGDDAGELGETEQEQPQETLRDVTGRARAHAAAGEWAEAAREYERALELAPAGAGAGAMIRLDLSRIYLSRLDRPVQAAGHLRRFVQEYPEDVAAQSARQELCRLAAERGWAEPLCAERDE